MHTALLWLGPFDSAQLLRLIAATFSAATFILLLRGKQ